MGIWGDRTNLYWGGLSWAERSIRLPLDHPSRLPKAREMPWKRNIQCTIKRWISSASKLVFTTLKLLKVTTRSCFWNLYPFHYRIFRIIVLAASKYIMEDFPHGVIFMLKMQKQDNTNESGKN